MSDLISRKAVLDAFWELEIWISPSSINEVVKMIESVPSAERTEVIRCKDCKSWDELYKRIYDHHYEILKSEESEGRTAKLSLSNWILDLMTSDLDYDYEPWKGETDE